MSVKVFAPAKINLFLEILNRRNDGYHSVDMIMQSVNLCDELVVSETFDGKLQVDCDKILGCSEKDNIVYKLAEKFFKYIGVKNPGVHIKIKKNIPEKAGLAGGSSDGAAALIGLNKIFSANLSVEELCDIAKAVGSDIPFCIVGGTALATGIGTKIDKIDSKLNFWIVIVKPKLSVSTKEAYQLIDNHKSGGLKSSLELIKALKNGNFRYLCDNLFNRFEENMRGQEIGEIKEIFYDNGCNGACMSGSGPSIYGIFESFEVAKSCANVLESKHENVFLCNTLEHGAFIN